MPRKRGSRRPPEEFADYVVAIETWKWRYSFGISAAYHRDEPYSEFRSVEIGGRLLGPRKAKADRAVIDLSPKPELNFDQRQETENARVIGYVQAIDGVLRGYAEMPEDALPPLLQALATDRMRYVLMRGAPLRYRKATIRDFSVEMEMDEEDLPPFC